MRFEQLPLYIAIYEFWQVCENRRSDSWLTTKSEDLYYAIGRRLKPNIHFDMDEILSAWSAYGKSANAEGTEQKKDELTVQVAQIHGSKCFYLYRGVGECSDTVSLDRIIPGDRGGRYTVENCVICCKRHNSARNNKSIEDFLRGEQSFVAIIEEAL